MAVAVFTLCLAGVLASAGSTLGYDYLAYDAAARRVLAGQPLYSPDLAMVGPGGEFLYPPPFALALAPLVALADPSTATLAWTAGLVAVFVAGVAILPVRPAVRWAVLLLAGLMWPFLYAVKLGEVGPILFTLFAAGWRWLDGDATLGATAMAGTLIKVQPVVVLAWAALRLRWRSLAVGAAVGLVAAAATTLAVGAGAWADYAGLLIRINQPVATPHNFSPGAVALQAGLSSDAATIVQWASVGAALAALLFAALRRPPAVGYLTAVVASQVVSPILWDHYALLLLLPVAWALERGRWWLAAVPLALSLPLTGVVPPAAYPVAFGVTLAALLATAGRANEVRS